MSGTFLGLFAPGLYEILIIGVVGFLCLGVPLITVIIVVVVMNRRKRQAETVEEADADREETAADE